MQLRFEALDPTEEIVPAPDAEEPVVWVRRLLLVRELASANDQVIRDVRLRRGLNIVWAPPVESDAPAALFTSGVHGHTAGKTTFCRLVRYAMGEASLGTEATRRRIREKLPAAWILAEVVVLGEVWTVARPVAVGAHPFCVRGVGVEPAIEGGLRVAYQVFLEALDAATTGHLPAKQFPARGDTISWDHLLPWLSRDQECRFANFLVWRDPSSDSDAPALNADQRQFLLRSLLGIITDAERAEQQNNARLLQEKLNAAARLPLLEHQARVDHRRVEGLLGVDLPEADAGLFKVQVRQLVENAMAAVNGELRALAESDSRAALQASLEQALVAETDARRDVAIAKGNLEMEEATIALLRGQKQDAHARRLPPGRDYCGVPLDIARDRGCPLASDRPIDLQQRLSDRTFEQQLNDRLAIVAALKRDVEQKQGKLNITEVSTKAARTRFLRATTEYENARERLLRRQEAIRQTERLVEESEAAGREAEQQRTHLEHLEADIQESYHQQERLREQSREALGDFSRTFDYVVRALLGDGVEGRVHASGRSLSLLVEHQGERESAALATIKLLAFDLAALTASVRGQGGFPRFLVHDGPREADMDLDVYHRLFLYAAKLEQCYEGEAGFQYIVTTTTPPPDRLATDPWLRLKLAGEPAEERLLRMDL